MNRRQAFAHRSGFALALLMAGGPAFVVAPRAQADSPTTQWTSGTATSNSWSVAGNWDNGVPDSTTNAYTSSAGANILLGTGAQAKTLFVDGPISGQSQLSAGDLTLSDQLWINIATGTAEGTAVPLRLYDGGSSPVSVTANNVTLGADPGNQGPLSSTVEQAARYRSTLPTRSTSATTAAAATSTPIRSSARPVDRPRSRPTRSRSAGSPRPEWTTTTTSAPTIPITP
jgi:hypothetical protein